jgi:hypothetical protein
VAATRRTYRRARDPECAGREWPEGPPAGLHTCEAGETQGCMRVLVDADTLRILGAAILGMHGDDAPAALGRRQPPRFVANGILPGGFVFNAIV